MVAGQNDQMDEQISTGGKLKGGKISSKGGSSFLGELIVPGGLLFLNQMSKRRKSRKTGKTGKTGKKVKGGKSKKARGKGKTRGKK